MEWSVDRPVEAFAALAWVICTTDEEGTAQERDYLYERVRQIDPFCGMEHEEFSTLMGHTRTRLFQALPNNGLCLAPEGVEHVIRVTSDLLDERQRHAALRMAVGIARSDELIESEIKVLHRIREGFGISRQDGEPLFHD